MPSLKRQMPTQDVLISRGYGVTLARRAGSIRRGPLIAASVACVAMVAGLVVVARSGKPAAAPTAKPTTPDLSTVPNLSSSLSQGPQGASLAQGERFFLQLADRQDPTRIAGDVTADRSVPKGERRYELTQPRAWFFLQDGRSVHVEAASGLLTVARQTAGGVGGGLESGSLVGDVVVRLFAVRADNTRPEPGVTPTIAVLRTSRLSIDWVLGQFDAPEDFDLAWETIAYSGRGVLAQFDPQTRVLDSLAVASTREIVIDQRAKARPTSADGGDSVRPPADPVAADVGSSARPDAATPGKAGPADEALAAVESFYTLRSPARVRVMRDQATLDAPSLRGGVRLINGELPKSATAVSASDTTPSTAPIVAVAPGGASATPAAVPQPVANPQPAAGPTRITLAGPLEVRRALDAVAPAELARDDWWARLGDGGGGAGDAVVAQDASRGMEMQAATATVMGTRGLMTLEASVEQPVVLRSDSAGTLTAERVEADRANQTVRILGAGTLVGVARAGDDKPSPGAKPSTPPSVRWNESAAFEFAKSSREFERLDRARFVGEVASAADGSVVTGNQMVVDFALPVAQSAPAGGLVPARARVLGQATVADARGNRASGDVLAVEFATDASGQASPASFEVQGQASAEFDGQTLKANSMQGTLVRAASQEDATGTPQSPAPAPANAVQLANLLATGDAGTLASFVGKDGVRAQALTIQASPLERSATLRGGPGLPARVTRAIADEAERAGSEFAGVGPLITFDEAKRTVTMGEGGEVSLVERAGAQIVRSLQATALGAISFDESAGVATLRDGVVATMREQTGAASRTARMDAGEVTVRFERVSDEVQDATKAATPQAPQSATANLRATSVEAASLAGSTPVRATIQEFVADAERPRVTYHIEAPKLTAQAAANTFEATGAGRLLATRGETAEAPTSGDVFASSGAGDTLVSWRDSMRYVQAEQRAVARGLVRLAHRETAQSPPSLLECETLTLDLLASASASTNAGPGNPTPAAAPAGTPLRQALAEGGVWGSVQSREFTAARALFDAVASRIDAFGDASATVTVAAAADQAPLVASRIRIDTKTGRIEVIDPGTIQATQPADKNRLPATPPSPR
jgi:hypothetical protein